VILGPPRKLPGRSRHGLRNPSPFQTLTFLERYQRGSKHFVAIFQTSCRTNGLYAETVVNRPAWLPCFVTVLGRAVAEAVAFRSSALATSKPDTSTHSFILVGVFDMPPQNAENTKSCSFKKNFDAEDKFLA